MEGNHEQGHDRDRELRVLASMRPAAEVHETAAAQIESGGESAWARQDLDGGARQEVNAATVQKELARRSAMVVERHRGLMRVS